MRATTYRPCSSGPARTTSPLRPAHAGRCALARPDGSRTVCRACPVEIRVLFAAQESMPSVMRGAAPGRRSAGTIRCAGGSRRPNSFGSPRTTASSPCSANGSFATLHKCRCWQHAGWPVLHLPANIAAAVPRAWPAGLVAAVHDGFPGARNRLRFEITKSALMDGSSAVEEHIEDIRKLGAGHALDDFGIDLSSLRHLRRFPVDLLQMDRSFISAGTENPRRRPPRQGEHQHGARTRYSDHCRVRSKPRGKGNPCARRPARSFTFR